MNESGQERLKAFLCRGRMGAARLPLRQRAPGTEGTVNTAAQHRNGREFPMKRAQRAPGRM
jgi:hypothetical protein